jgi:hypothetical protein
VRSERDNKWSNSLRVDFDDDDDDDDDEEEEEEL